VSDDRTRAGDRSADLADGIGLLAGSRTGVTCYNAGHGATHAAYYAMYHAARAVLIRAYGLRAPTKHSVVVGRFGQLAKQAGNADLMAAGRLINEMQEERLLSDYAAGRRPPSADAAAAVRDARSFLEACARHHGLPPPKAH
jgi:uncharacterized protein (UPF0332 family)